MIWEGGKNGKKTQRLLAWEKKNSTQQPGRKKKLCRGKKVQRLVAEEKKLNANSLPGARLDHYWSIPYQSKEFVCLSVISLISGRK